MRASSSKDPGVGRYLGIKDGYFLYGGRPDWVYVYCQACWRKEIMRLDFVQKQDVVARERDKYKEVLIATRGENATLKKENAEVKAKLTTFEEMTAQHADMKAKLESSERKHAGIDKLSLSGGDVDKMWRVFQTLEMKKELVLPEESSQSAWFGRLKTQIEKLFSESLSKSRDEVLKAIAERKAAEEKELEELNKVEKTIADLIAGCTVTYANQETEKTLEQTRNKIKLKQKSLEEWTKLSDKVQEIAGHA